MSGLYEDLLCNCWFGKARHPPGRTQREAELIIGRQDGPRLCGLQLFLSEALHPPLDRYVLFNDIGGIYIFSLKNSWHAGTHTIAHPHASPDVVRAQAIRDGTMRYTTRSYEYLTSPRNLRLHGKLDSSINRKQANDSRACTSSPR